MSIKAKDTDIAVNFLKYLYHGLHDHISDGMRNGFTDHELMYEGVVTSVYAFQSLLKEFVIAHHITDVKDAVDKAYKFICEWDAIVCGHPGKTWISFTYSAMVHHIDKLEYPFGYLWTYRGAYDPYNRCSSAYAKLRHYFFNPKFVRETQVRSFNSHVEVKNIGYISPSLSEDKEKEKISTSSRQGEDIKENHLRSGEDIKENHSQSDEVSALTKQIEDMKKDHEEDKKKLAEAVVQMKEYEHKLTSITSKLVETDRLASLYKDQAEGVGILLKETRSDLARSGDSNTELLRENGKHKEVIKNLKTLHEELIDKLNRILIVLDCK